MPGQGREVVIGAFGGLGAARVDHDHPSTTLAKCGGRPGKSGTVHIEPFDTIGFEPMSTSRSVRSMSGTGMPVEVAEETAGGEVLGHLVERCRREHVGRPECRGEIERVEHRAGAVDRWIADHQAARSVAVLGSEGHESPLDLGEGLVEAHLFEHAVAPHERTPEPVGVVVEVLECRTLRAEEAVAAHVVAVAADPHDTVAVEGDLDAAPGFAQRAGVMRDAMPGAFLVGVVGVVGGPVHGLVTRRSTTRRRHAPRPGRRERRALCSRSRSTRGRARGSLRPSRP